MNGRAGAWLALATVPARMGVAARLILVLAVTCLPSVGKAEALRVEQGDAAVSYDAGTWQTVAAPALSGGSLVASSAAGSSISVTFTGTSIAWIGYRCACAAGIARVYLDGTLYDDAVHTYAEVPQPQEEIYRISGLPDGTHVFTIEVTGAMHSAGTAAYVAVDAFDFRTAAAAQTLEESDGAVSYTGNWVSVDDTSVSGGSVFASREAGATATVTFTGTGIAWIGYQCECASGTARVTLDGTPRGTLNTYGTGGRWPQKQMGRIDGLPYGEHELVIEVTGEGATDTPYVVVDAFRLVGGNGDNDGDTAEPSIEITSPANGTTVSGLIRIEATGQDDTGIYNVWFYAGGQQIGEGQMTAPPYDVWWDTTTVPDGQYFLGALAVDQAGRTGLPTLNTGVIVENVDNAPTVAITAPASGARVTGTVTLTADAVDDYGVTKVRFLAAPNTLIGEDTAPPWEITRDTSTIPSGSNFLVYAQAIDTAGNVGSSSAIIVTVQH